MYRLHHLILQIKKNANHTLFVFCIREWRSPAIFLGATPKYFKILMLIDLFNRSLTLYAKCIPMIPHVLFGKPPGRVN